MRITVTLTALLMMGLLLVPSDAHATWNQKAQHYCTYWGSAGLFPDDEKALAANPLAKLKIPLRNGTTLEFPLLYIFKGYELDESPKEWNAIWAGFAQACPGWPKPQWLQKLESWKAANRPKEDPRIAKRKARIKSLLASADSMEARAASERQRITSSPAYMKITGGSNDWKVAAMAKKDFLQQIVSLKSTRYIVVGKVVQKLKEGAWVNGLAIATKPAPSEPGTRTTATRFFVQTPKAGSIRANGDFLASDLFLLGIPTQQNPNVVFGGAMPAATKKAVANASKDLRQVNATIRSGETRLKQMLRPVTKLEEEAKRLRLLAQQLQSQNTGKR